MEVLIEQTNDKAEGKGFSYYKEFTFFRSIYRDREYHLAKATEQMLPPNLNSNDQIYRVLDVGSSDGRLLMQLISNLTGDPRINAINALALEPNDEAFRNLIETGKSLRTQKEVFFRCNKVKVEDYLLLEVDDQNFDLILCSHVFYHFEPNQWGQLISELRKRLRRGGKIVVILDSYNSPIYKSRCDFMKFCNKYETVPFGGDISAEEFLSFIEESEIPYQKASLNSVLLFPTHEIESNLIRALTFLFRRRIKQDSNSEKFLRDWLAEYSSVLANQIYTLPWAETVFAFDGIG